jgi:hypothetical protein
MASVVPSRYPLFCVALIAAFLGAIPLSAQEEAQKAGFYEVSLSADEVYKYSNLKFAGDYTSWESPSGLLVLGKTEAGVTVLIVLGAGTVTIQAPEQAREKFTAAFGAYPVNTAFTTLYMRLHPQEFQEVFGKQSMTKSPDEAALAKAKEIYDQRFLTSYHAGPRAILPPVKTRVMDFDTPQFGQITNEEGYWISLNRITPFTKVYASRFVNPKQK